MTNVSHEVHSLSVGDPSMIRMIERNKVAAPAELKDKLQPMNGYVYVTDVSHDNLNERSKKKDVL